MVAIGDDEWHFVETRPARVETGMMVIVGTWKILSES